MNFKTSKSIFIYILGAIICFIIYQWLFKFNDRIIENTVIKTDTIIKVVNVRDTLYKPGKNIVHYEYITIPKEHTELTQFDTIKIVQNFLSQFVVYKDSINFDNEKMDGYINITDTIHKNHITGRSYKYDFNIYEKTIVNHVKADLKTQLFIGGNMIFNDKMVGLIGEVNIVPINNKNMIGVGIGIITNETRVSPIVTIKYGYNILKR